MQLNVTKDHEDGSGYRFIPCNCGATDHHIIIHKSVWDGVTDYSFQIVFDRSHGFWKRVRLAFRYIFGLEQNRSLYCDVLVSEADFMNLPRIFDKE